MSSFYTKPIVCLALILLLGCAHKPAKENAQVLPPPVLSPAVEAPDTESDVITRISPPQPVIAPSDSDDPPTKTDLADQTNASASGVELPTDEADEADVAAVETVSSTPGTQQQLDEALDFCEAAQALWQNGELESALEALDKAYSLILTVEPDDPAKLVQQKEDLRFLISKRILEIYASRNIVVNGNHNAIPRELNTNIQKEINLFTRGPETFLSSPINVPVNTGP